MTKTKIKPVRGKDGKFKKPDPVLNESAKEEEEEKERPQPLATLVRVSGQSTKSAAIQTHNLKKGKDGSALPEIAEGALNDE